MKKWTILCASALILAGCARHRSETSSSTTYTGGTGTSASEQTGQGSSTSSSASQTSQTSSSSQLSTQDQQFIKEAVQGGMAEVQMGRLAAKNAESDAVKQLGQKLIQDHGKANQELKKIASQKGVTLSSDIGEHKTALDHLKSLQGKEFDQAFIQHAVQDHQKDIKKFQQAAQQLQDSDLKAFAQKTLPTLQEHLQMAKSAQSTVGGTGSSSSSDTGTSTGTSSQNSSQKSSSDSSSKSSSDSSTKPTQQQ